MTGQSTKKSQKLKSCQYYWSIHSFRQAVMCGLFPESTITNHITSTNNKLLLVSRFLLPLCGLIHNRGSRVSIVPPHCFNNVINYEHPVVSSDSNVGEIAVGHTGADEEELVQKKKLPSRSCGQTLAPVKTTMQSKIKLNANTVVK